MVKTLHFHCREHGFKTPVWELSSCMLCGMAKKKKKETDSPLEPPERTAILPTP